MTISSEAVLLSSPRERFTTWATYISSLDPERRGRARLSHENRYIFLHSKKVTYTRVYLDTDNGGTLSICPVFSDASIVRGKRIY